MSDLFYGMTMMRAHMKAAIAEATASATHTTSNATRREVRCLEEELDRLELILEAQWSLLREKLGLTDADLKKRIREIDLEDGKLDGRVTRTPMTTCPQCQRQVSARDLSCVYCGEALNPAPF